MGVYRWTMEYTSVASALMPPTKTSASTTVEGGGDVLVSDSIDHSDGFLGARLAGDEDGKQGEVSGVVDGLAGNDLQALVGREGGLKLAYGLLDGRAVDIAVDDYLGGVDEAEGEVLFHHEEGFSGLGAFGEGVDAVKACFDIEIEIGGGGHGGGYDKEADHRRLGNNAGYKLQKPCPEVSEGAILDLPKNGMGRWLILGPMIARLAGRRVRVAAKATTTTRIAPMARDWKKEKGDDQDAA